VAFSAHHTEPEWYLSGQLQPTYALNARFTIKCKAIHDTRSIFWKVRVSVILRKEFTWTLSNSEWLPRQSCLNLARTVLYWSFVCGDGGRAKFTKEIWIHETNSLLAFRMLLPAYRNVKINSNEQQAIFAHEWQSALRLTW
jgi:hypothetical protein